MQIGLEGPASDSAEVRGDTIGQPSSPDTSSSLGPVLFAGMRDENRGWVVPVAELTREGLRALPEETGAEVERARILLDRLRPGTELTLFHNGVRVGALVLDQGGAVSDPYCGNRPQGRGQILLVPGASQIQRFLALEESRGTSYPFDSFRELTSVYEQRVASLDLGAEAIPLVGATWPPSLLEIREHIEILDLPGGQAPAVLATFVNQDRLEVGPAPDEAYALMILGERRDTGFELTYTWYRPVATQGKGAPRYFSRMDWDRDGREEILLEVLGAQDRWFAALDREGEGWSAVFQDPCGVPPAGDGAG